MIPTKRIRTALYGDQPLTVGELEVIHTPAMQRLYGLKQLGLTDRVYVDASHSRLHHVIGVLHHVDKIVDSIKSNLTRRDRSLKIGSSADSEELQPDALIKLVDERRPVIRFIGLLHDLTHAPFGHTVEDEIRLIRSKHDDPDRQSDAFYRLLCQLVAWLLLEAHGPDGAGLPKELEPFLSQGASQAPPSEELVGVAAHRLICDLQESKAKACLKMTPQEVAEMFAHLCCAMTALLHLEALHDPHGHQGDSGEEEAFGNSIEKGTDRFDKFIQTALQESTFTNLIENFRFKPRRDAFMLDIVGNTVCADLLDYAGRDSHFAGLRLNYDAERIAENFTLVSVDGLAYEINHQKDSEARKLAKAAEGKNPFEGWCLRTAISLFSHKYRTDIPGELMNLLNVRYYLYERVIFHSTKCAAGSMLGTALQLLGWRNSAETPEEATGHSGKDSPADSKEKEGETTASDLLPPHLRFLGDEVFLHDISCALDLVLSHLSASIGAHAKNGSKGTTPTIDTALISAIGSTEQPQNGARSSLFDGAHNGLVQSLLELRKGQNIKEAIKELRAARLLLYRLASRRYFRPVYRALASTKDAKLQAGAEILADLFRDPAVRFNAERKIEDEARLDKGTVTIHCPVRNTAQKIANVFLTKPDGAGEDIHDLVCKLKDIGSLDKEIFGEHEAAVTAVEKMYRSMWRLTVYVAPEHIEKWKEISKSAGQVIFQVADRHKHFAKEQPGWVNDQNLEDELKAKIDGRGADRDGGLGQRTTDKSAVEQVRPGQSERRVWLSTKLKAISTKRDDRDVIDKVMISFGPKLDDLQPEVYEAFKSKYERSVQESSNLSKKEAKYRKNEKLSVEDLNEFLVGLLNAAQSANSAQPGLFGDENR